MAANEPEQVIEQFCELFNAGDLDGLITNLYEDDAVFIPPGSGPVSGKAAVADVLKGFLGMGGTLSIVATTTLRTGDIALTHSRWHLDIPGGDPMEHVSAELVRRQADGTWKYAVDNPWGGEVLDASG
jgi:ketosteroid isomerase-like protein